jgi:hypothetical protein
MLALFYLIAHIVSYVTNVLDPRMLSGAQVARLYG